MSAFRRDLWITVEPRANGDLYTCGDIIRAKVHLHSRRGTRIDNLTINFKCKAKTLISTGIGIYSPTIKCKVYIFNCTKILANQDLFLEQPYNIWDAVFQIPWEVLPHSSQLDFKQTFNFESKPGHLLPPSWTFTSSSSGRRTQSIDYYLEAEASLNYTIYRRSKKSRLPLVFTPSRGVKYPDPFPWLRTQSTMQTIPKSSTINHERLPGLRETIKSLLFTGPRTNFIVRGSVPSAGCVGAPINIILGLKHEQQVSMAPLLPEVFLIGVHVRLKSVIDYRVRRYGIYGSWECQEQRTSKIVIVNRAVHPTRIFNGLSIGDIISELRIDPKTVPTFRTFNIGLAYVIKVSVRVVCAGSALTMDIGRHLFTIHPSIYRQPNTDAPLKRNEYLSLGQRVSAPDRPGSSTESRVESSDALPAYPDINEPAPAIWGPRGPQQKIASSWRC